MTVNALERIALLRNLASEIIAEIELLAASNPNLIRLRGPHQQRQITHQRSM